MADVSKLARARMAKATLAGPHPDADLLTAFAERSATPAEREQVLAHLATCADCREVVALAAPEAVPLEHPMLVPRRSRWLPAGVFRWGAMAAAVAVVAVVVIVESPKYQQPNNTAMDGYAKLAPKQAPDAGFASNEQKSKADGVAVQAEPKAAPSPLQKTEYSTAQAGPEMKDVSPAASMDQLAKVAPAAPPPPPSEVARGDKRERTKQQDADVGGLLRPAINQPNATVADMEASSKPAARAGAAANVESASSAPAAARAPARSEERANYDSFAYGRATGAGTGAGVAINGQAASTRDLHVRGVAYKWTVTSDGRLQRSSDGRTWFFVPVDPKARLRALASDGDEVWAGGDRGVLYHSSDSGDSWKRVAVDHLSGDIIRLVINGDTIQISTSSGQTISMSPANAADTPAKPASPR